MTRSAPADARHRELCNQHAAVAIADLADGAASIVARNGETAPVVAELVLPDGVIAEPADAIAELAAATGDAKRVADQRLEHLIAHLARAILDDHDVNITATARDAGIAKQTIYNRLNALGVDPSITP